MVQSITEIEEETESDVCDSYTNAIRHDAMQCDAT